jgi:aerobic-type carbon monoxide dehydrogenase small subunit (CoxS/CutS family)
MILTACSLLLRDKKPSREAIVKAMDGNLCRCGAHRRILAAIEAAAEKGTSAS